MMSDGTIKELTQQEAYAAAKENQARIAEGKPIEQVEITDVLARFFRSRSKLFREIWGRKLVRGLTPDQKANLQTMVGQFLKKEQDQAQKWAKDKPLYVHQKEMANGS